MYVLFLEEVRFDNGIAAGGEIYYVQIRKYRGGHRIYATTQELNSTDDAYVLGWYHTGTYMASGGQSYVLGGSIEMLQRIWVNSRIACALLNNEVGSVFRDVGGKLCLS